MNSLTVYGYRLKSKDIVAVKYITDFKDISSPFHKKIISMVVALSLKIFVRQFLSPFHKDYLTTNFNLKLHLR